MLLMVVVQMETAAADAQTEPMMRRLGLGECIRAERRLSGRGGVLVVQFSVDDNSADISVRIVHRLRSSESDRCRIDAMAKSCAAKICGRRIERAIA